jgi:capsid assembly protease
MTSRVLARITGHPWLIQSEALETIIQLASREPAEQATLDAWKNAASREALATRPGDQLGNAPTARVRDGVAIIPVAGPIFRYSNMLTSFSGATALADLAQNLAVAIADSRVRAILLEIDSPGGEVTGLAEAAQQIAAAAAVKPTVAFVEGSAQSAAYWLASAAGEIVISSTGAVGSLGAVVALQDTREAQARNGVRRYEFVSSQTPNKRFDPTTDAGAARLQAFADRLASEFLGAAATNRGMTVDELLAASQGGGTLVGSDAVAARLADRVDGFEPTLARLAAGGAATRPIPAPISRAAADDVPATQPGPEPRATSQENDMSESAQADAPAPAPENETQAAASEAPRIDYVAAERARASAIMAAAQPEFAALAALAVAQGWPLEQFSAAQQASSTAVETARTQATAGAFRDSLPAPLAGNPGAEIPAAEGPDKWRHDFTASADLQAEFRTEGAYVAFRQAEADGKVRPLKKRG